MYIPCCPLTETNANYLARQREAFYDGKTHNYPDLISLDNKLIRTIPGIPPPDFPSGPGESDFRGRLAPDYILDNIPMEAQRGMGLAGYDARAPRVAATEQKMLARANEILGFMS